MGVKRGILAFGCAVAFAAAPLVAAAPASATCPWGTSERSPGACTKGGAGVGGNPVAIPDAAPQGPSITGNPGELARVDGIPCTPEHYGTCLAMQQNG